MSELVEKVETPPPSVVGRRRVGGECFLNHGMDKMTDSWPGTKHFVKGRPTKSAISGVLDKNLSKWKVFSWGEKEIINLLGVSPVSIRNPGGKWGGGWSPLDEKITTLWSQCCGLSITLCGGTAHTGGHRQVARGAQRVEVVP